MTPLFRKFLRMNWILVLTMFCLLVFGVFAIHGASWTRDSGYLADSWNRQAIWIAIGTFIFFGTSLIDYRWILWGAVPMYILGICSLVTLRFLGVTSSGRRVGSTWAYEFPALPAGGRLRNSPSRCRPESATEFPSSVPSSSSAPHHLRDDRHPPFLLILKEPDIGSAAVWLPVAGAMLLIGSTPFRYLTVIALCGTMVVPVVYFFVLENYQRAGSTPTSTCSWAEPTTNKAPDGFPSTA